MKPIPERERFPARARAIVNATDQRELVRACWRYAGACWYSRHVTGRSLDLARAVVLNDVVQLAKQSLVRPRMPKRFAVRLTLAAEVAAGELVRGARQ